MILGSQVEGRFFSVIHGFIGNGHLALLQVHISMQGQEALFSENMTLKEVIKHLKEQQSFRTTIQEKARTPLQIPRDVVLATGE